MARRHVSPSVLSSLVTLLTLSSLPQDSEARPLMVGAAIAGDYAIAAWSNVLMWPADQAPYCMTMRILLNHKDSTH